ncbi:hypothetical protein [Tessaracoccus antarcticus]|uniref:Peptidase n=1 Tax=Tessaracoccus antarcticus TaxID=2479848 RepID=A0A3M0G091_9ACTN|nr:hypothetical protein [Tessaracoccus antarcticus]RMB58344.1 hypothetical protein EAX62_14185 [Tessaracoccus antarcticus]
MIRRTTTLALATLLLAAPWAVSPAAAAPPAQAATLCAGSPRGCALETNDWLREGATFPVTVIGNANARIQVVVYLAVATDGVLTELRPISSEADVITNTSGVAHTDVAIPTLGAGGDSSGWALVSVGGMQDTTETLQTVGQFVPFGARVPLILGDGYGDEKPAGSVLDLQFTGTIPGTRFAVDYADADGIWHDTTATADAAPANTTAAATRPDAITTLRYVVPRGLTSTPHKFRLRNVSDSAISPLWLATPTVDGTPREPAAAFQPPPVGADLTGANLVATHPEKSVVLAAGGVAGLALVVTVAGAVTGLRRRGGLR